VWSLGIILFLMLCIDALDIIQIPEMSTGGKRTTLRMPFLSYASVVYPLRENATGACGNLTNQLDDPPAGACERARNANRRRSCHADVLMWLACAAAAFVGLLTQDAPTHERFWRHFPVRSLARLAVASPHTRMHALTRSAVRPCRLRPRACRRPPRT
jgi:hypothetical protein